jgi:hypothetical protein
VQSTAGPELARYYKKSAERAAVPAPLAASASPGQALAGRFLHPKRQAGVPAIEPAHGATPLYDGRGQLCTAIRRFPERNGDDEYEAGCCA